MISLISEWTSEQSISSLLVCTFASIAFIADLAYSSGFCSRALFIKSKRLRLPMPYIFRCPCRLFQLLSSLCPYSVYPRTLHHGGIFDLFKCESAKQVGDC